MSPDVAVGAVGTLPGFLVANLLFWVLLFAFAFLLKKPMDQIWQSEGRDPATHVFAVAIVVGLACANFVGCASGFFVSVWLRRKLRVARPTGSLE